MSKKYAVFSSAGELTCLLIGGVHSIPKGAVVITDEQFSTVHEFADCLWTLGEGGALQRKEREVNYAQLIADSRFRHEVSGIQLGDIAIDTGRDSQALITAAALSAMLDPEYRCTWKALNGPVELGAAELIDIATAVRAHVQACFDRENELLKALTDGRFSIEMLDQGWPP